VAHHFCSRIPFYNGREATKAIRKVMGDHYQHDDTNIFLAAWRSTRMCQYISEKEDIVFFQNATGLMNRK
jgi:omega-6 fatty acid desaturase (delta-12 desaturase)